MKVEFTSFSPDDLNQVMALDHQAYPPKVRFSEQQLLAILEDPEVHCYVAKIENGQCIGVCLIKILKFNEQMRLISVVVEESCRNQGVGSMVMNCVLSIAKHADVKNMVLQISSDNEKGIKFFQRYHFKKIKDIEPFLFEGNSGQEFQLILKKNREIKVFRSLDMK